MKVFLSLGSNEILAGYLCIDPIASQQNPNKVTCDPADLSSLIDSGEAQEILAPDVLDYYPLADKITVVENWFGKLGHEGMITVGGLDLNELGRLIYLRELGVQQVNELIYGVQQGPALTRRALLTMQDVLDLFSAKQDYKITQKRFNGAFYLISAQRQ